MFVHIKINSQSSQKHGTDPNNIKIKEISANKFEVYSGPYDSFDSMKSIFFRLNKLGFDNLNVININK